MHVLFISTERKCQYCERENALQPSRMTTATHGESFSSIEKVVHRNRRQVEEGKSIFVFNHKLFSIAKIVKLIFFQKAEFVDRVI
jgi:hypothetical protein